MSHLYELPSRFILKRFKPDIVNTHPDLASSQDAAVLIYTSRIGNQYPVYDTTIVEYPLQHLGNSVVLSMDVDGWFDGNKVAFPMKHDDRILNCTFAFNNCVVDTENGPIPVLKQSTPCELYGNKFIFLHKDMYEGFRFSCKADSILRSPPNPAGGRSSSIPSLSTRNTKGSIPQHILNAYIDGLLEKNENCPIEMTPLTKETIRITPCGHSMSVNAAEYWITCKHSCPVCREGCSVDQLLGWA